MIALAYTYDGPSSMIPPVSHTRALARPRTHAHTHAPTHASPPRHERMRMHTHPGVLVRTLALPQVLDKTVKAAAYTDSSEKLLEC